MKEFWNTIQLAFAAIGGWLARRKRSGAAAERGLAREKGRGRRKEKLWHLNG